MANHRGVTILDVTDPDRGDGSSDDLERRIFELQTGTGTKTVDVPGPADSVVRQFEWMCFSRAEAKVLRTFIEGRLGMALPFWLNTWSEDFTLNADHGTNSTTLTVLYNGYSALVFPLGNMRRHIHVKAPDGTVHTRYVSNAVDNGNGTETLTLESLIAPALTVAGTLISFLRYSRLDTDEPAIAWTGGQYARSTLPVREIPNEAPA
jgi:hypothetical protein